MKLNTLELNASSRWVRHRIKNIISNYAAANLSMQNSEYNVLHPYFNDFRIIAERLMLLIEP